VTCLTQSSTSHAPVSTYFPTSFPGSFRTWGTTPSPSLFDFHVDKNVSCLSSLLFLYYSQDVAAVQSLICYPASNPSRFCLATALSVKVFNFHFCRIASVLFLFRVECSSGGEHNTKNEVSFSNFSVYFLPSFFQHVVPYKITLWEVLDIRATIQTILIAFIKFLSP